MGGGISKMAKPELLATIRDRYRASSKKDKGRVLDEFIAVSAALIVRVRSRPIGLFD